VTTPPKLPPDQPPATSRRLFLRYALRCAAVGLVVAVPASLLWASDSQRKTAKRFSLQKPDSKTLVATKTLMIDAGHGGKDPGAIGKSGTYEKDVTLDIARRMAQIMGGQKRITPHLTRDRDEFIPLGDRVQKGRAAKADFFISIHADSTKSQEARGFSAYSLAEEATDEFSRDLAQQENLADRFGKLNIDHSDQDVANILLDLATRQNRNVAQRAKIGLVKGVGREWRLLNNPIRAANFAVLRAPDVPSVLVETGFLSNPQDEALLREPAQRQRIAALLAQELSRILLNG
jgi:N-acetylmuramoyl-L-alanine amidase